MGTTLLETVQSGRGLLSAGWAPGLTHYRPMGRGQRACNSEERTGVMNKGVGTENESELRGAEERGVRPGPGFRAQKTGSNSWLRHL